MTNVTQKFDFNSHSVRVVLLDGQPWFVAKDVCDALGYANSRKATADHLDSNEKGVASGDTLGGTQKLQVISESGLYALVLRSRKPEARRFAKWVTGEVLPTIRKTGVYGCVRKPELAQAISKCMEAANSAAAHTQKLVFESLMTGERRWYADRFLLGFERDLTPVFTAVPEDASVTSTKEFANVLRETPVGADVLEEIANVVVKKLAYHAKRQSHARQQVLAV